MDTPVRIDAILPTYNRARMLPRALDSGLAAEVPAGCDIRFLVVDNNSTDDTRAVIERYVAGHGGRVSYLFERQQGRHHALNTGIAHSAAEIVAFFDDDERIAPDWFAVIAGAFAEPEVDYIAGPVRPDWSAAAPRWLPPDGYGGVLGIIDNGDQRRRFNEAGFAGMPTGGNFAIRKRVLDRCGPYLPDYMYSEDRYLYERLVTLGAAGFYIPALVVFHHIPAKRLQAGYFRQWAYTEGRNRGKLARGAPGEPRSVLGAPLWRWRQAGCALASSVLGRLCGERESGVRFKAELDAIQFAGFYTGKNLRFVRDRYIDRA